MSYGTKKTDPATGVEDYNIDWFDKVKIDRDFIYEPLEALNPLCPAILHQLRENMVEGMYVAGGSCITHIDPMHPFTDIDVYLNTQSAQTHITGLLESLGFKELTGQGPCPEKIKVWSDTLNIIQLIYVEKLTDIQMLLSSFDLNCCKIGFDMNTIAIGDGTKSYINGKILNLPNRVGNNLRTLERILKYTSKGYKLQSSEVKRLFDIIKNEGVTVIGPATPTPVPDPYSLKHIMDSFGIVSQPFQSSYVPPSLLASTLQWTPCPKCGMTMAANSIHAC